MKKSLAIFGIVLLVLAASAGGAWFWLTRPVPLETFDDGLPPVEQRQRNSDIETALLAVGVESSIVAISNEVAYVAYDLPADSELGSDELQLYILGILAGLAPEAPQAAIVQYIDEAPVLAWEADLAGARAVQAGTADEVVYLATITKTTF